MSDVALLVPVRNEAHRIGATLTGLLDSGAGKILFLDDRSTDGTGDMLRRVLADLPPALARRVRVVDGVARPEGWTGKTWACQQLAMRSDARLLVFVDADVQLAPGALAALVDEMDRQDADVLSVFPRQLVRTWSERLIMPLIPDVVLCFLPFPLLRAPAPAAATAHGALLAFRRSAYDTVGGFAAVRTKIVEDVAIARLTRRKGLQLGLALGGELAGVRMYGSYREVIDGMGRGLVPTAAGSRVAVTVGWLWHLLVYTAAPALAPTSRRWRWVTALGIVERLVVEGKTGGRDWAAALGVAASPVAAAPVVGRSLRRRQTWKGRTYG
nr:glycosyltransferase family 2 protein [Nakamurella flavida]